MENNNNKEKVFLSLGSNAGDKKENIRKALNMLDNPQYCKPIKVSPLYSTEPWGKKDQDRFINCAVEIITALSPWKLLSFLQDIEKSLGKDIKERWGPRTIDIDIIFYGNKIIFEKKLIIPHPGFRFRKFVLIPLYYLSKDIVDPLSRKKISELSVSVNDNSEVIEIK